MLGVPGLPLEWPPAGRQPMAQRKDQSAQRAPGV